MPPFAVQIAATAAAHMKTVSMESWGGYHEAERVKIAFQKFVLQRSGRFWDHGAFRVLGQPIPADWTPGRDGFTSGAGD